MTGRYNMVERIHSVLLTKWPPDIWVQLKRFGPAEEIDDFREEVSKYPPKICVLAYTLVYTHPQREADLLYSFKMYINKPLIKRSCISTVIVTSMPASSFSTILFLSWSLSVLEIVIHNWIWVWRNKPEEKYCLTAPKK